jgi:hypothetical protein
MRKRPGKPGRFYCRHDKGNTQSRDARNIGRASAEIDVKHDASYTDGIHGVGSMKMTQFVTALAVTALTGAFSPFAARAQTAAPVEAHNVVLVHGAWADGSSWAEVIPYLQAAG